MCVYICIYMYMYDLVPERQAVEPEREVLGWHYIYMYHT